jgi:hypothetical protein
LYIYWNAKALTEFAFEATTTLLHFLQVPRSFHEVPFPIRIAQTMVPQRDGGFPGIEAESKKKLDRHLHLC